MIEWISQHGGYALLLVFFIAFTGIGVWAYLPVNRSKLEQHRNIPFRETE